MTRTNIEIIKDKLLLLNGYLEELKEIKDLKYYEYMDETITRRGAERLLQLLVEVSSDINSAIISNVGKIPPESYYESFIKAGEYGVISKELAQKLAPSAGLRNRIIHEYGEYKDSIVYKNVKKLYELYSQYLIDVNNYLHKHK